MSERTPTRSRFRLSVTLYLSGCLFLFLSLNTDKQASIRQHHVAEQLQWSCNSLQIGLVTQRVAGWLTSLVAVFSGPFSHSALVQQIVNTSPFTNHLLINSIAAHSGGRGTMYGQLTLLLHFHLKASSQQTMRRQTEQSILPSSASGPPFSTLSSAGQTVELLSTNKVNKTCTQSRCSPLIGSEKIKANFSFAQHAQSKLVIPRRSWQSLIQFNSIQFNSIQLFPAAHS